MSQRRTRAMGQSPGGFKSIDMSATTRQPRKPKVSQDAPAPSGNAPRAKAVSGTKRKADATVARDRPVKKTRHNTAAFHKPAAKPRSPVPAIQKDTSLDKTFRSPEEPPFSSESDETFITLGNKPQEPIPPTDAPSPQNEVSHTKSTNLSMHGDILISPTLEEMEKTRNKTRFAKFLEMNEARQDEAEEKALSECDDEEWARRLPAQLLSYGLVTTPKSPSPSPVKWSSGALAMFVVRGEPDGKAATTTEDQGKPSRNFVPLSLSKPYTLSRVATSARPLTKASVIAAISTSIDWFEGNPNAIPPTPAEMELLLNNFIESHKAKPTKPHHSPSSYADLADHVLRYSPIRASNNNPQTPPRQVRQQPQPQQQQLQQSQAESPQAQHPQPQQSQQQQQADTSQSWAAALSASTIRSVLSTPVSWFTRRGITRQNLPATEPRPVRAEKIVEPSASIDRPRRQRPKTEKSSTKGHKSASSKNRLKEVKPPIMKPLGPTPPPQPEIRRGRIDAHLPVHLRGVLYEHLPREWQAVSQHMKVPDPVEVEEEVDLDALYALAEKNREKRWLEERKEKEASARKHQPSFEGEEEEYDQQQPVGSKRKVTFKVQPKVFSAKLGPSTFGLPLNIDDSSSEEEVEVEDSDKQLESIPEEFQGVEQTQSPSRPCKRARIDDNVTGNWTGDHVGEKYRARPSSFVTIPPQEAAQLAEERDVYEEFNPLTSEDPKEQKNLDEMYEFCRKRQEDANIFKQLKAETERAEKERLRTPARLDDDAISDANSDAISDAISNAISDPISDAISNAISDRPVLSETPLDSLNKQRNKALLHKPKVPSSLHQTQTMSPVHEMLRYIGSTLIDPEVLAALDAIPDSEIVAESFTHIPYAMDPIILRLASMVPSQAVGKAN